MGLREEIIDYGYQKRKTKAQINDALRGAGLGSLGPRETALLDTGTWGQNAVQRLRSDALEFSQGLNTLISAGKDYAGQLVTNPSETLAKTSNAINNYMTKRGPLGAVEDVYNMVVEPYGLDTQNIARKGLPQALIEAPSRAWAHPGYTALDLATMGKGKIPKKAIGNILEAKNAPKIVQDFIPSEKVAKVNDIVNTAQSATISNERNMALAIADATRSGKGDLAQAVRNLETGGVNGVWQGDNATLEVTKKLADISDTYNRQLQVLGANANKAKNVTIAQYIMEALNPNRTNNIHTNDILNYLEGKDKVIQGYRGKLSDIEALRLEAEELYNRGIIKPISHRATFKADPNTPGLVADTDRALGQLADRRYGWATPEELPKTLFKAYEGAARELRDANVGRLSIDEAVHTIGQKVTPQELATRGLSSDEIIISPNAFNEVLAKDFGLDKFTTVGKRVSEFSKTGLDKGLFNRYKDDLFIVNKNHLRPIVNRFAKVNGGLNWLNSLWKTAQLITPKYFLENRIGNTLLNWLEGVSPQDYLDAMKLTYKGKDVFKGKYSEMRPERLKTDTSYYGVLGDEFRGAPGGQAFKQAYNMIKEGVLEGDLRKFGKGSYDVFSAPVLAFESQFEGLDRYANFIRQAKKLSSKTGEDVGSIIRRSATNNKLYGQLMKDVNRSLGDYIGRNWAINPELYNALSFAFPFFKYPTQGLRTLLHQARNNPLRYHSMVTVPQRIGRDMWLDTVALHPELEDAQGGVIDTNVPQGLPYTVLKTTDVHPLGAGAGILARALGNWEELGTSPLFDVARILSFRDRYGNRASAPWYFNGSSGRSTFMRNPDGSISNQLITQPTLGDRLSYAGAELANLYIPAVKAWNSYIGPGLSIASPVTERLFNRELRWYPRYNATMMGQLTDTRLPRAVQPFISGRTEYPGSKGMDSVSKILGTRSQRYYANQAVSTTMKEYKSANRKLNKLLNYKKKWEEIR